MSERVTAKVSTTTNATRAALLQRGREGTKKRLCRRHRRKRTTRGREANVGCLDWSRHRSRLPRSSEEGRATAAAAAVVRLRLRWMETGRGAAAAAIFIHTRIHHSQTHAGRKRRDEVLRNSRCKKMNQEDESGGGREIDDAL